MAMSKQPSEAGSGLGPSINGWGFGPIRECDDLSPYTSGPWDLPDKDRITHEPVQMISWVEHWDRVVWAIKTREGRVIVVMQQRHEADRTRVGGQVEIINAPFRDTAVKGLGEDVEVLEHIRHIIKTVVRGL